MLHRMTLLCGAVTAMLALAASPAAAMHVDCGDLIIQDTTLDSDLVDCPGDGLVIGASGVKLDLAGHLIDGAGGSFISPPAGVANRAGHGGVTVSGGRITDFPFFAVEMRRAQGGSVSEIVTSAGILLLNSPDIRVQHNEASLILVFGDSERAVVARNRILPRPIDEPGGRGGRIALVGGFPSSSSPALSDDPTGSPEDVLVDRNELLPAAFGGGIGVSNAPSATVTRNRITATNPGVFDAGIQVDMTFGPVAPALIERNEVSGTTNGVVLFGAADTVLVRNIVHENAEDGIVTVNSRNARIERNRAERNGDDGIDVGVAPATIAHNVANVNGDLGIQAVSESIDAGGNKASGNGNSAQCVNVSCK